MAVKGGLSAQLDICYCLIGLYGCILVCYLSCHLSGIVSFPSFSSSLSLPGVNLIFKII